MYSQSIKKARTGRPPEPAEVRFWRYVRKPDDPDACWDWLGACLNSGYGRFWGGAEIGPTSAHRFSWLLAHPGEVIPDGLGVLHTCDNPPCTNPRHLWLGTTLDNQRDAARKGRKASGDRHWARIDPWKLQGERSTNAKLTDDAVREIRRRYATGETTLKKLAAEYRVTFSHIARIVRRVSWSHVN